MHGERQTLAAVPPCIVFRPVEGSLDHRTWTYLPLSESESDENGTRVLAVEEMIEPHNCQRRRAGDACAAPVRLKRKRRAFGVYAFVEVAKAYECAVCSMTIEQYTVAVVTTIKRKIHDMDLDDTPSEVVTQRSHPTCALERGYAVSRSASAFIPRWWRGKLTS
jgi:hypothetical protein